MKTEEIRKLTDEQIAQKLEEISEELFNLRLKQATGSLENPGRIRDLRKTVARLKTILKEREIQG